MEDRVDADEQVEVSLSINAEFDIEKVEFYVDGELIGVTSKSPYSFSFTPEDEGILSGEHELIATAYDEVYNRGSDSAEFEVR